MHNLFVYCMMSHCIVWRYGGREKSNNKYSEHKLEKRKREGKKFADHKEYRYRISIPE